ncbi:unnamed protein product [Darwinula stevensoni]|uniref:SCP domain-containing protein n=1 Tax=Darwinula stevensoni TaxID=69355 RepID=A0A7R9FRX8_9CRUS|nr:unnamed protein product [Darwinula stevensoni]CAG0902309.1 unnamed protein product [Darwinula stevensoni]
MIVSKSPVGCMGSPSDETEDQTLDETTAHGTGSEDEEDVGDVQAEEQSEGLEPQMSKSEEVAERHPLEGEAAARAMGPANEGGDGRLRAVEQGGEPQASKPKNAQKTFEPSEEGPSKENPSTQPQTTVTTREKPILTSSKSVPSPKKKRTRERIVDLLRRSGNRKPEDEAPKPKTKPRSNSWISGFFRSLDKPKPEASLAESTSGPPLRPRRHSQEAVRRRSQDPPSVSKDRDRFSFPGKEMREAKRRYSHAPSGNTHHEKPHWLTQEDAAFAIESLVVHNTYRAKHGVPPLKLNLQMCWEAKERVERLCDSARLEHRVDLKYGENIFRVRSTDDDFIVTPRAPVETWYAEIKHHYFGHEPSGNLSSGHFTQVVWRDTEELGVACGKSSNGRIIVVAIYFPQGNLVRKFTENVPTPLDVESSEPSSRKFNDRARASLESQEEPDDEEFVDGPRETRESNGELRGFPASMLKQGEAGSLEQDDATFAIKSLVAHNTYRAKHRVPPLKLNLKICEEAKEWMEHLCRLERLKHRLDWKYGESIYWVRSTENNCTVPAEVPVKKWYSEIQKHNFDHEPSGNLSSGHFTQMVWKDTEELGVARGMSRNGHIIVVAFYFPPGNFLGKFIENVPFPVEFDSSSLESQSPVSSNTQARMSLELQETPNDEMLIDGQWETRDSNEEQHGFPASKLRQRSYDEKHQLDQGRVHYADQTFDLGYQEETIDLENASSGARESTSNSIAYFERLLEQNQGKRSDISEVEEERGEAFDCMDLHPGMVAAVREETGWDGIGVFNLNPLQSSFLRVANRKFKDARDGEEVNLFYGAWGGIEDRIFFFRGKKTWVVKMERGPSGIPPPDHSIPSLPSPSSHHVTCSTCVIPCLVPEKRFYLFGGETEDLKKGQSEAGVFIPTEGGGAWYSLPSLPREIFGAAGASLDDGSVLIIGGWDQKKNRRINKSYMYDPREGGKYHILPDVPESLHGAAATVWRGTRVILAGGDTGMGTNKDKGNWTGSSQVRVYDLRAERWEDSSSLHTPRYFHGLGKDTQDRVIAIGGIKDWNTLKKVGTMAKTQEVLEEEEDGLTWEWKEFRLPHPFRSCLYPRILL